MKVPRPRWMVTMFCDRRMRTASRTVNRLIPYFRASTPSEGRTDSIGNCPSTIDSRSMSASSSGSATDISFRFISDV